MLEAILAYTFWQVRQWVTTARRATEAVGAALDVDLARRMNLDVAVFYPDICPAGRQQDLLLRRDLDILRCR